MSETIVTRLSVTAVKGTRIRHVDAIELTRDGALGDRRFYVIDERGQMRNGKQLGELQTVVANLDPGSGTLTLRFPDRPPISGRVALGERVATRFFSRPRHDELVVGPWSEALSDYTGQRLRLVSTRNAVDRGARGRASLISRASLRRLAGAAARDEIDARRFRMLIEVDGIGAHQEDRWIGRQVRIGDAEIHFGGNIGRCLVAGRDPESGLPTLPVLDILGSYRRELETTEPLPFGIYGEVRAAGRVRVGDAVTLLGE